ncbi:MAG: hypothetical protein DRH17_00935 [Deltaproteobacteria bacterium]|nr:MAG: hypothetical protein DRH17_00935 [Deltaproteobacteria bacterium]
MLKQKLPLEGSHIFKKNMEALFDLNPELHTWLDGAQADPGISPLPTNDGSANLLIRLSSGNQVLYYERSPSVEAEFSVIHGMDLSSGSMTCLVGMGLGYTVSAILQKMAHGHHIMVLEPNPWLLKLALHQVDLVEPIRTDNLHIVKPDQKAIENLFLHLLSKGLLHKKIKVIVDPRSEAISIEYKKWGKQIEEAYRYANVLIKNATLIGRTSIQNEIENTIIVSLVPGVEILKSLVKGKPVLLVGPGPSLDRSMEKISQAQKKMFVFAFAASWRNLLSNGIAADFVLTSDKNIESFGMLKHTRFAQQTPLIFSSSSHPKFVKKYLGPCFAVPQKALYPMLPSHKHHRLSLSTGTSVAVFAFNLAVYLEADPIILIGLDLAVDNVTHANGHHFRRHLEPDDPRLIKAPGMHNTIVRTFPHLSDIKRHLEWHIKCSEARPINATLSGARIEGTLEMDIDEVCKNLPDLSKKLPSASLSLETVREKLPVSSMKALSKVFQKTMEICSRGIKALEEFDKRLKRGQIDQGLANQINQDGKEIQDFLVQNPLLNQYMSSIWFKLKRETQKIASISEPGRRLSAEIRKNLEAFTKMKTESEKILERISEQQMEMARVGKGMDQTSQDEKLVERISYIYFLSDNGLHHEAAMELDNIIPDNGFEIRLLMAKLKARMGLLSEATSLLEGARLDAKAGKKRRLVLTYIEEEKRDLIKKARGIIQSASRIDAYLMFRELARSLPNDTEAEGLKQRLSKIFEDSLESQ